MSRQAPILAACLLVAGCRTTKPPVTASAPQAATRVSGNGLVFAPDAEQSLYLKMLAVETSAGSKVANDQLHTSRGVIECRQGGLQTPPCLLRVRLGADELSSSQPLAKDLAKSVAEYAKRTRPELKDASLILTSAVCDYLGKKSPPYDVTAVHCAVSQPRASDEAVFSGRAAEELSEGIRGEAAYGAAVVVLTGAVSCQWLKSSPRTPCIVRAQVGGVLLEKISELSPGVAAEVARALKQAASDHARLQAGDQPTNAKKTLEPTEDIVATLNCVVDNTKIEAEGQRTYNCRARI